MGPRVRYSAHWKGTIPSWLQDLPEETQQLYKSELKAMSDALWELEVTGAAPVLPDGRVGGNAAFRIPMNGQKDAMVVSKSGKLNGVHFQPEDACVVTSFNHDEWSSDYFAISEDQLPTSDTPMHYAALYAHEKYSWMERPDALLHGHALETEEIADRNHLPISTEETMCSTPEDTAALMDLFAKYPYPEYKVFIRKGHGFVVLGKNMQDALDTLKNVVVPAM